MNWNIEDENQCIESTASDKEITKSISPGYFLAFLNLIKVIIMKRLEKRAKGHNKANAHWSIFYIFIKLDNYNGVNEFISLQSNYVSLK